MRALRALRKMFTQRAYSTHRTKCNAITCVAFGWKPRFIRREDGEHKRASVTKDEDRYFYESFLWKLFMDYAIFL